MPDGDRIHAHLAPRYEKCYQQICEDFASNEKIAHNILLPLKEEIKSISNKEVIRLIKQISSRFEDIALDLRYNNSINWEKEAQAIDQKLRFADMKKSAKNLLIGACKEQLQDIKHGAYDVNMSIELIKKYMIKVYESHFESKVLLKKDHYNNVEVDYIKSRLLGMQGYVWNGLSNFARQAMNKGDFNALRRPPQRRNKFNDDDLMEPIA